MGTDYWAMGAWGANNLVNTGKGLRFKVKCPKHRGYVEINLNEGTDLYDLKFYTIRKKRNSLENVTKHKPEINGVYFDQLVEIIDGVIG